MSSPSTAAAMNPRIPEDARLLPSGAREFMESHGIVVEALDLAACYTMMEKFIADRPTLWFEDIGDLAHLFHACPAPSSNRCNNASDATWF